MHKKARLDLDRSNRISLPEAVYCQAKSTTDCVEIVQELLATSTDAILATRATPEQAEALTKLEPDFSTESTFLWNPREETETKISLISAGTSDLPVARECALTLQALGHAPTLITDVGVAGLHRLLSILPDIEDTDVIIAIAGMEGALPTVLAGLVAQPIIAIPTSTGYGTAFHGVTALLSMLTSCSPGITVVGIDNGYGAACAAHRIVSPSNS